MMWTIALLAIASAKVVVGVDAKGNVDLTVGLKQKDMTGTNNMGMHEEDTVSISQAADIQKMTWTQLHDQVTRLLAEVQQKDGVIHELTSALSKAQEENEAMAKKLGSEKENEGMTSVMEESKSEQVQATTSHDMGGEHPCSSVEPTSKKPQKLYNLETLIRIRQKDLEAHTDKKPSDPPKGNFDQGTDQVKQACGAKMKINLDFGKVAGLQSKIKNDAMQLVAKEALVKKKTEDLESSRATALKLEGELAQLEKDIGSMRESSVKDVADVEKYTTCKNSLTEAEKARTSLVAQFTKQKARYDKRIAPWSKQKAQIEDGIAKLQKLIPRCTAAYTKCLGMKFPPAADDVTAQDEIDDAGECVRQLCSADGIDLEEGDECFDFV